MEWVLLVILVGCFFTPIVLRLLGYEEADEDGEY